MKAHSRKIIGLLAAVMPLASRAADPVVSVVPFPTGSAWHVSGEGASGSVIRSGRTATGILLEGTGLSAGGASPERAVVWQQPTSAGSRQITARLDAFTGASTAGEMGIALDVIGFQVIGMRLLLSENGVLRREAATFSGGGNPPPQPTPLTGVTLPIWLRISWTGGLRSWTSANGLNWTEFGTSVPITLPSVHASLIVTSGSATQPACGHFSKVWIVGADADENGLQDGYEMSKFGRLLGPEALFDPDLDGRNNLVEWQQGTNPLLPDVAPQAKLRHVGGACELSLPGRTGWTTKQSSDGVNWTTAVGTSRFDAVQAAIVYSVPTAGAPRMFFRLEMPWPNNDPIPIGL